MKRRLLSAFLAVMMVLTMAPVAFAGNDSEVSSTVEVSNAAALQNALTNATDGTVIKLTDNITVSSRAKFSGQSMIVTLDLNNYTLTGSDGDYALSNENGGGATTGTLIVKNGTIKRADDVKQSNSTVRNYGQMELNNVQVQGNYIVVKNEETATLTMNNCTLTAPDIYGNNQIPSGLQNYGTATANNCTIKSGTAVMAASWADSKQSYNSNTYLNDCTISGSPYAVSSGRTDKSTAKQRVNVNGGSYTGNIDSGAGSDITINAEVKGNMRVVNDFSYNLGSASYITSGPSKVTLAEGGSVSGTINAAAKNGNTYYSTVTNAVEEATNGNTIELVQDTTEDVVIPADKTVTLELNGKKLTNVQSDTITVTKGAKLTIEGKGTVDNVTHARAAVFNNGEVVLNGGTFVRSKENGINAENSGGNSWYTLLNHGTMTINDGTTVLQNGHFSSMVETGYARVSASNDQRRGYVVGTNAEYPSMTINGGMFTGGLNTVKNDDNGTIEIKGGTFTNYTQAAFQNHHIATITGGTFDGVNVYAILNCGTTCDQETANDKHQLTITGGNFNGKIYKGGDSKDGKIHYNIGSISISGGYFTTDPTDYVASGYVAGTSDVSGYGYKVVAKTDTGSVEVKPAVAKPEVKVSDNIQNKEAVEAAAKTVSAPTLGAETGDIVKDINEDTAKALIKKATTVPGDNKKLYVQSSLKVEPTAYDAANKTLALEITPQYRVVASTADTADKIKLDGDTNTKNAQVVQDYQNMTIDTPTEVTMELPTGFAVADGDKLSIQHTKNGTVEYYTGTVTEQSGKHLLTFTTNGFSPFVISVPAASIGENVYPTLQAAVDSVKSGKTIKLEQNVAVNTKATVAKTIKFTVDTNEKTFAKENIVAGANTTVKVTGDASPYTYEFTYTKPSSGGSSSGKTTYKVTTSAVNNGGVNASPSNAEKGAAITITLSPDKGYKLDKLTVTDGSGKTVSTVKKSDTVYTFTMPASAVKVGVSYVKATETPSKTKFNDVSANDWFASAVDYVTGKGMMNGTAANTFSPKANTTRGMLMTVLARHAGEDTTGGSVWYEKGMNWAKANGVSDGTNPQVNITREQLAAMLYRYAQNKKYDVSGAKSLDGYTDAQSVSSYAVPALQWANAAGVVTGKSGSKLDPKGYATRAEVAAMLMRFCENVEK